MFRELVRHGRVLHAEQVSSVQVHESLRDAHAQSTHASLRLILTVDFVVARSRLKDQKVSIIAHMEHGALQLSYVHDSCWKYAEL